MNFFLLPFKATLSPCDWSQCISLVSFDDVFGGCHGGLSEKWPWRLDQLISAVGRTRVYQLRLQRCTSLLLAHRCLRPRPHYSSRSHFGSNEKYLSFSESASIKCIKKPTIIHGAKDNKDDRDLKIYFDIFTYLNRLWLPLSRYTSPGFRPRQTKIPSLWQASSQAELIRESCSSRSLPRWSIFDSSGTTFTLWMGRGQTFFGPKTTKKY